MPLRGDGLLVRNARKRRTLQISRARPFGNGSRKNTTRAFLSASIASILRVPCLAAEHGQRTQQCGTAGYPSPSFRSLRLQQQWTWMPSTELPPTGGFASHASIRNVRSKPLTTALAHATRNRSIASRVGHAKHVQRRISV